MSLVPFSRWYFFPRFDLFSMIVFLYVTNLLKSFSFFIDVWFSNLQYHSLFDNTISWLFNTLHSLIFLFGDAFRGVKASIGILNYEINFLVIFYSNVYTFHLFVCLRNIIMVKNENNLIFAIDNIVILRFTVNTRFKVKLL